MPHAQFEVRWSDVQPGRARGFDRVELCISANPGEEPRPLDRIASGGELSRIMLALLTVLAVEAADKTLVFDEVDAGIGGKLVEPVGMKLHDLTARFQLLFVTHQSVIAVFPAHLLRLTLSAVDILQY